MKPNHLLLATLLCGLVHATAALAEEADQPVQTYSSRLMPSTSNVLKNLPYSAEVIHESQMNLADGNQIVSKSSTFSYRDSAGRTRQEFRDVKGDLMAIHIVDPVAEMIYMLNVRSKVATRMPTPGRLAAAAAQRARERVEQLRKEGKLAPPRNEIILRRSENDADNVRIAVDANTPIRIEADALQSDARRPNEFTLGPLAAFGDARWAGKATTRDLGTRDIDGVRAQGKLRSYDIPAGEIGNRNAIVISDESWYSPELQISLLVKHSDPRSGDKIYRLGSLKREEPAPALFMVPADYAIKDPMAKRD